MTNFRRLSHPEKALCVGFVVLSLAASVFSEVLAEDLPVRRELTAEQRAKLTERDHFGNDAIRLRREGKLTEAIAAARNLLAIEETVYGQAHEEMAATLKFIAELHEDAGDFTSAKQALQRRCAMLRSLYSENDWRVVDARSRVADCESVAGLPDSVQRRKHCELRQRARELEAEALAKADDANFAQAVGLGKQALDIRTNIYAIDRYPQGHPELASILNALGRFSGEQGDLSRARMYYEQALELRHRLYPKTSYPDGHPELATSLGNLGAVFLDQRDAERAREYLEQALAMHRHLYPESQYPQGHPNIVGSLNNLAQLFEATNNIADARKYYELAVEDAKRLCSESQDPNRQVLLAKLLNNLGALLIEQSDYTESRKRLEEALDLRRRLYPPAKYPQGHPDLAQSLNSLGTLLKDLELRGEARNYLEQSLAMNRQLYPESQYPQGHPALAASLNNLGSVLSDMALFDEARQCYDQALAMNTKLYPTGHPHIARTLGNLGSVWDSQGAHEIARQYQEKALAEFQRLYPKDKFPDGHPDLAKSLHDLGNTLFKLGDHTMAREYFEESLDMRRRLLPKDHPDLGNSLNSLGLALESEGKYDEAYAMFDTSLRAIRGLGPPESSNAATVLDNLGSLLSDQGKYPEAGRYYEEALTLRRTLYSPQQYPQGNRLLATSLNNMASFLYNQGRYPEARTYYDQAIEMRERLLPETLFPLGHPEIAQSYHNLGVLLDAQADYAGAFDGFQHALTMYVDLVDVFAAGASEAEALSFASQVPSTRDALLSISRRIDKPVGDLYELACWRGRGAIQRIICRRQRELQQTTDSQTRGKFRTWLDVRHELASLMLAPAEEDPRKSDVRRQHMHELSKSKENLERELANLSTGFARAREVERSSYEQLSRALPPKTVMVDLVYYNFWVQDPKQAGENGRRSTPSYVAFVLPSGGPVKRVELGPAAPVDLAARQWRTSVTNVAEGMSDQEPGSANPAEQTASVPPDLTLRRLVWEPVEKVLPADTTTIFLCADGGLAAVPWGALPGGQRSTVLLEKYAFALVPHGQFVLEHLRAEPRKSQEPGVLLAVGGVGYDDQPSHSSAGVPLALNHTSRGPGEGRSNWRALPGTKAEIEGVASLAGDRPQRLLCGKEASTSRILGELPEARWAVFATHGFFADRKFRSNLQVDEGLFKHRALAYGNERRASAYRNPLVLSGIVLAGANLPQSCDELGIPQGDGGILTAEAIAGLPLDNLELAVLSACDTAIGDVAGGEGVFGLQRAFHIAGTRNVVASLWKIDDRATAALMSRFYYHLWHERRPPLAALREAQLAFYRNPGLADEPIGSRGFGRPTPLPEAVPAKSGNSTAPTRLWASFVLSGLGE